MKIRVYTTPEEMIYFEAIGEHQILRRLGYIFPFINTSFFEKLEKIRDGSQEIVEIPISDKIPGVSEEKDYSGVMVTLEENFRNAPTLEPGKGAKDGGYFLIELYELDGKLKNEE